MRRFNTHDLGFDAAFEAFLDERRGSPAQVDDAVAQILERIRKEGLSAVLDYARRFDDPDLSEARLRVSQEEIEDGAVRCSPEVREAIAFAAARIRSYHARQRPTDQRFVDESGVELGWRWTSID